ncbi:DUF475 domain-containing protein [Citromicrobium bathyomarinum]|uniref:DUF475 domain-containing protein n=1 Tax=unclassified Citromicrobium TaxID=2630544 RepID=UPI0006C91A89|nr:MULTISPECIES: DUF475 domain-containing protein [unclassified Citromicrobium]KPM25444.1 membrane protein [Citromicrobium sp. RCC1885]KPM28686.1 membrane protein [Citromicrobium sp. RCC1878]MAO03056.1 DUF475 domain-containing protein [Citromicrobium sp.]OAM09768.1 hypothetical protein A0U43_01410 [Citromicrobium sp. RCC1897]
MNTLLRHYWGSLLFTLVCFIAAGFYAWNAGGSVGSVAHVLWIVLVLSILEISLSFDNAVVNATVLREMDEKWQRRFLTWGILIAVFGMRIVFPLAIVAVAANLDPLSAIDLSLNDPERYEAIVSSAHVGIAGFGGAFLTMVGLNFFFDGDKDVDWIRGLELALRRFSEIRAAEIGILLLMLYGISTMLPEGEAMVFLTAGILGLVTYIAVDAIGTVLDKVERRKMAEGAVRSGLGGFLYLEVLDASFSFDGVIGAFALSNNMLIIALGLSIGALFVRSMTVHLVRAGTLTKYRFLEHGAFWAIIALGLIMLLSAKFHISESITGLIGAVLIGISLLWSMRYNRKHGTERETA